MKNLLKISLFILFIVAINTTYSQTGPPGMPGNYGGNNDEVPGGGAPIGGGLIILLSMGAAYASTKIKDVLK